MRVLVTGGVRSGKSRHAESLLTGPVTYLAPGPVQDDADWAARIAAHRARRPADWTTLESHDLVGVLTCTDGHVMVDCLGTWLTAVLDERGLWGAPADEITDVIGHAAQETADVLAVRDQGEDTVLVTNEVGLGVVPEHRSGRLFRDLLGLVNQRIAAACDEVHLVVAGRVIRL
ncbi:adenosylcobinamide kinase/adenosylcobinamide phosphate guanyltransferase [Tessaracoccus lapidicaptus]|uniref:Adenosylcobinamide kinase n=1 Tax=Tessaracoccus lapidicaptus TaxID=1427523 RepID=A0A1C0AMV6_9ACTN|nr:MULTISPECIES: bifunctional adenosylcobinamide kinase/adenosylcobinamide-phosphate guanylyltransferase [Tessaracoccus]AQX14771.1 adenosylcobinamide kinase/adenosylcobinamide phosphate guanyltransferase [Tessaracoccus sp. T2.5-30]OCL34569.1 adenosylcobinamide kinase/adenosylcobinamide phosphate guanyltransferase [Tessaracoccus lapidicaptus]VEP38865.1 Bifunctional adenosylcobalamin biosynthesis protein CobU [Tessaracoccus lapidicaptus]